MGSHKGNPALLTIVSTSKGSSAQIIEGTEQYLLFNNNGKKADFIGERVSDHRKKKGQKNVNDKKLSKQEKQDNVIVIVQIPLKQKKIPEIFPVVNGGFCLEDDEDDDYECLEMKSNSMNMFEKEECNVEAAIVSVSDRTKPVCICNKELQKYQVQFAYNGRGIKCDGCGCSVNGKEEMIYHCVDKKNYLHPNGYDLCIECGEKQLKFDELRGILDDDKNYILERNEDYPIRVTLQYYKATDNGVVNKEIMDDIVKQLQESQKQADFMGSLVTEYNPNRPNEWVFDEKQNDDGDDLKEIKKALKENCGNDWKLYLANFEKEEVKDSDLENITDEDLK